MNEALAASVGRLNGTVQWRDDDVDYLRVEIDPKRVQELSISPAIESINLAGSVDYLSSPDEEAQAATQEKAAAQERAATATRVAPPDRNTPPINPYLPTSAIGAPQFIAAHPTFDGRGVTVAVVDTNIDFLLPELRTAKALDGTSVAKFADIYSAAPKALVPVDGDSHIGGYMRVAMETKLKASAGKLIWQSHTWSVPRDDEYRLGLLNERMAGPTGDLNRDGNPPGSNELFAVLWDERTNTVWIDTNQNDDFNDEKPMTDYGLHHDVGTFGTDDPKTDVRETVGFVVQTDVPHQAIFVIPGYAPHGTGVAGAAFGSGFFGGKLDGVAPGAQIISITPGRASHVTPGYIEAVITAMKDPRVDIATIEFGNYGPFNDGRSTFSTIANRLTQKYGKLLFAGAGNGNDGLNGIISPADAEEVIAVGSYISKETSRVNYGVVLPAADNMNGYTSHGPTKEGGLKPNLLAPTIVLTTKPGFLPGENHYGNYSLPAGYQVYGGTSTSTPFAAAGTALLISAAKQSGVKYDARRLRWAIMSSARFLPDYSPEQQGVGLLQVPAAWEALKNAPEPIDIVSRAPVKAVLSEYLQQPNQGAGIFEREGWTAGQSGYRIISFTRTSGTPGPVRFQLRWKGNDQTFAAPAGLTLPLNTTVDVAISIAPKTNGVHSAILNLVSASGAVVHQVLNTIVAAEQLYKRNSFTVTRSGQAEWLHSQSYFVNVPAGTPALEVDIKISEGNVMPSLTRPNGRWYYLLPPDKSPLLYTRYQTAGSWSRVISNPDPGVWQITADNCNVLEAGAGRRRASFQITASLLGARFSSSVLGDPVLPPEITYSNTHAKFVGGIFTSALASTYSDNSTIKAGRQSSYEIEVAPGAARVGATLGTDENADLDLYLFDCTGAQCVLRDFANGNGANEQVAVDSPAAGKWKVVIDPFAVPDRGAACQYKDYFLHPALGRLEAADGPKEIDSGALVTQPVTLNVKAIPILERYLEAILFVTSELPVDTSAQKNDQSELYYPTRGILATASVRLKPVAFHPPGR
ncbi:MAG TPA: S8 family serine peptidase [Pyrinomonadaceae bacterium]|nr:S8 family serine peptidase [Pyrinomonadaceae bacterium]